MLFISNATEQDHQLEQKDCARPELNTNSVMASVKMDAGDVENKPYEHKSQPLIISKATCDALKPYLPPLRHEQQEGNSVQDQHDNVSPAKTTSVEEGDGGKTRSSMNNNNDERCIDNFSASSPSSLSSKPYVTLTYASSLDSAIAVAPGTRTVLSGTESKALTHYLRSQHDAILIGVGTAIADDPRLNCRLSSTYAGSGEELDRDINQDFVSPSGQPYQPRPVIIDPSARYHLTRDSEIYKLAKDGIGKGPWIFCGNGPVTKEMMDILAECGGEYVFHALDIVTTKEADNQKKRTSWEKIILKLGERGIRSVMIEGGGRVINELLEGEMKNLVAENCSGNMSGNGSGKRSLVDALVVTIAPLYLGAGGMMACPRRPTTPTPASTGLRDRNGEDNEQGQENEGVNDKQQQQLPLPWQGLRFRQVRWIPMGEDAVMCGLLTSAAMQNVK